LNPPSRVIDRVRAKVTRAKQHIQEFLPALEVFRKSNPYRIEVKDDTQTGIRVYCVAKVDDVPDELATIAADALQNLREPLDHLAYQLVVASRGGTPPDWHVYYPITASAGNYPANRSGRMKGVRQEVVDAIDATEPWKGGRGHRLWQLNELSNMEKHHLLIAVGSFLSGVEMTAGFPGTPKIGLRLGMRPRLPLKVGDELFHEAILPAALKMNQATRFDFDVSFDHPGIMEGEPALKTLQDTAKLVDEVISEVERFLS